MEYFTKNTTGRAYAIRLDRGDDLLDCLMEFIKSEGIKDAYIASAIGTLDRCVLHMVMTTTYPPVEHYERWEDKPLEISSIDGIIADGSPHLHMVVSDHEKAYSGHLHEGCRVLYLAEIVVVELKPTGLARVRSEQGILQLVSKPGG